MLDLLLPELPGGAATILRWLVEPGRDLEPGAPMALVLTERAEVLLPAPAAGTLAEPAPVGALVQPGARLGLLAPAAGQGRTPTGPRRATPLARRLAQAHGVDLAVVVGTGPGARIGAADVRALIGPAPLAPAAGAAPRPASGGVHVPVATATVELEAGAAMAAAAALRESYSRLRLRVGLTALVVAAAAALLPDHPELNGAWWDSLAVLRRRIHIAVGEPGAGGLRWALVRDAGDLTLRGVARALARSDEAAGDRTFTIVSLAEGASWQSAAPPPPGTAAALSVGAPGRRALARADGIVVGTVITLTLSYDARLADHRQAVTFLARLGDRLERPRMV